MADPKKEAVIVLLASDAIEAMDHDTAKAAILLVDAALSILVTCHPGAVARRELAAVLSTYVARQIDVVIRVTGGAHG